MSLSTLVIMQGHFQINGLVLCQTMTCLVRVFAVRVLAPSVPTIGIPSPRFICAPFYGYTLASLIRRLQRVQKHSARLRAVTLLLNSFLQEADCFTVLITRITGVITAAYCFQHSCGNSSLLQIRSCIHIFIRDLSVHGNVN